MRPTALEHPLHATRHEPRRSTAHLRARLGRATSEQRASLTRRASVPYQPTEHGLPFLLRAARHPLPGARAPIAPRAGCQGPGAWPVDGKARPKVGITGGVIEGRRDGCKERPLAAEAWPARVSPGPERCARRRSPRQVWMRVLAGTSGFVIRRGAASFTPSPWRRGACFGTTRLPRRGSSRNRCRLPRHAGSATLTVGACGRLHAVCQPRPEPDCNHPERKGLQGRTYLEVEADSWRLLGRSTIGQTRRSGSCRTVQARGAQGPEGSSHAKDVSAIRHGP